MAVFPFSKFQTRIGERWVMVGLSLAALLVGVISSANAQVTMAEAEYTGDDRVEKWEGKTILALTPHPDDEAFGAGGTLAKLADNGNNIHVVIYTSDNAGSNDPEMTKERLAEIRKKEEEEACAILKIPREDLVWLGYEDGMLEYVDQKLLTKQIAQEIRRIRPDAIFTIDPGAPYQQWHKSDHRMASIVSVDAIRAARWRLYFPELEQDGFKAWDVPVCFFFYSAQPNYTVDISDMVERKCKALAAHTSQFGSLVEKYDPNVAQEQRERLPQTLLERMTDESGRAIEKFRRSTEY
ncbi:MAG: PIG-L deacetylase family protein [bacterium]